VTPTSTPKIAVPTTEEREAQERAIREWPQIIESRYDLAALTSFLKKTVAEKKRWGKIDLTKPAIGETWLSGYSGGMFMNSGDWSFRTPNPKEDKFTFSFFYNFKILWFDTNRGLEVTFNCIRKSKNYFELIEITGEEQEVVWTSIL